MDKFSELRAFVSVVEQGGFSAAARSLGQSRSSVNRLVIALEERLGIQVLHRTTRSVSTTSVGRALYQRARQILQDLEEMEQNATSTRSEPIGKLRLSAPPTFRNPNFSQIIVDFMRRYPKVEVEARFDTRLVDPIAEGFDVVLRIALPDEETNLVDHRVLSIDYVLCASPEYLAEHGVPNSIKALFGHYTLFLGPETTTPIWALVVDERIRTVPVKPVLFSNDIHTIHRAALAGKGIAVLPLHDIRSDIEGNKLICVLPEVCAPPRKLMVIYPPARHLSEKVRLFTEFVTTCCAEIEREAFGPEPQA